jgi:DNA (cytosine-5)-methyltransferase 1
MRMVTHSAHNYPYTRKEAKAHSEEQMRVLDLFSGIGGFSLGLERAGFRTVAFCEIDPYARAVLKKHWPDVPIYEDVRALTADTLCADGIGVDVICGGFPCQDISAAGKRAGITGERSGLWSEYARLIGELRPRFVIVENVAALLSSGMGTVLGDLAALGYDAQWDCIPAAAVGAPHRRDRVWVIAVADALGGRCCGAEKGKTQQPGRAEAVGASEVLADAEGARLEGQRLPVGVPSERAAPSGAGWWAVEPDVGRVANGIPFRVDRLKCLGNAVVPQIPEMIGRAIMEAAQHD